MPVLPAAIQAGRLVVAQGICRAIAPSDTNGAVVPQASDPAARTIKFIPDPDVSVPSQDQLSLKGTVEHALSAISRLFPDPMQESKFRPYFVQLISVAQVGLVGPQALPEIAKPALDATIADLIDDQGASIKNAHLAELTRIASCSAVPLLVIYVVVRLFMSPKVATPSSLDIFLGKLSVSSLTLSCFLIMLVGCLLGVVLSYAARATKMTLIDLMNPDADQLKPAKRLAVSAGWTLLVGYLIALDVMEIKIGAVSSHQFATDPMLAFLIGAACGLSNLTVPGTVVKKVGDLIPSTKP